MEDNLLLVRKAKKGDVDAFGKLYEYVYHDMYRFALYTLCNEEDAKDVVSEAVTDAFATIGKLKIDKAFRSWIFRILSNKCNEKIREYTKKTIELDEKVMENHKKEGLEEEAIVRKAFFELDNEERIIIGMHLFCGYKSREIAKILHMNENTVRSKESRGLKKLAEKMESEKINR